MTRIATLALALALTGCGGDDTDTTDMGTTTDPTTNPTPTGTTALGSLVDVATEAGTFEVLLAAVEAAGLTDTLATGGPFTVMAPTDDAFAKLPDGTVDALLADPEALGDILFYHLVDGAVPSEEVAAMSLVPTLHGSDLKITTDGGVFVNDAEVTAVDVEADNGIIHVIDTVLMPPGSIADIAVSDPDFSTLVAALSAADLVDTLSNDGPFTVFAPTNDAFDALPAGTLDALLADVPALTDVLLYHVYDGKTEAAVVVGSSSLQSISGVDASITESGGVYSIAGAPIIMTDIPASNGIIHVIDAVMLP